MYTLNSAPGSLIVWISTRDVSGNCARIMALRFSRSKGFFFVFPVSLSRMMHRSLRSRMCSMHLRWPSWKGWKRPTNTPVFTFIDHSERGTKKTSGDDDYGDLWVGGGSFLALRSRKTPKHFRKILVHRQLRVCS